MNNVMAGTVTPTSVIMVVDGNVSVINDSHINYSAIRKHAAAGDYAMIAPLLDVVASIVTFGKGLVTVEDGIVLYKGKATHNAVTSRIMDMIAEGLEVAPMLRFLENLMDNPSNNSVNQLYGFLEVNDLPITEDGFFLAYKMADRKPDGTLTDNRTKTYDYGVGAPPATMPRNEISEDRHLTCAPGLHVCAQGYLGMMGGFGGNVILVKVNPRDVVSVPVDYNNAKMRVCQHETVMEVDQNTRGSVFTSSVYAPVDTVLATSDNVMSVAEAMVHFYGDTDIRARNNLRKRLNSGKSAKRVYADGIEMVQLIDAPVDDTPDLPVMKTYSLDAAARKLGIKISDMRKRANRGKSADWVDADKTMVVLLAA